MDAVDRGWKELSAGRWHAATVEFDRAIAAEPGASRPRVGRAIAAREVGDLDEALHELQRAIALDPGYALAYRERGAVFAAQGLMAEALRDLDRAVDLEPSAMALSDRGGLLSQLGRWPEAVADLRRATNLDPDLAVAHFNLGASLASSGQVGDAVPAFRRALSLGFEPAGPALERALQVLFVEATADGSVEFAIEAVLDSQSPGDLQESLERFPFMALPDFMDALRSSESSLPPADRSGLRQRIQVLQRLAAP